MHNTDYSTRRTSKQDEYPTLSGLAAAPVEIIHDGQVVATVESPNAAFSWLAKNYDGVSVSWMLRHGGYSCRTAAPATN